MGDEKMLRVYKPTVRSKFCIIEVDQYGNRQRYIAESIFDEKDANDLVTAYNRAEAAEARTAQAEKDWQYQLRRVESLQSTLSTIIDERDTLQTDNDIAMKIINMVRNLVIAGETEMVTSAVKRVVSERDELLLQLQQAQQERDGLQMSIINNVSA